MMLAVGFFVEVLYQVEDISISTLLSISNNEWMLDFVKSFFLNQLARLYNFLFKLVDVIDKLNFQC